MAKYGFLGIPVPKELGGQGCDILTYAMCVEELSKVCGTTGVIVSAHTSLCVDPIVTFGTPEQKAKYVPDLASGKKLGAFGLTEPGAGTDAQGQQTKAVLDGDEWVLTVLSASLQTVRKLTYISLSLLQVSSRSVAER